MTAIAIKRGVNRHNIKEMEAKLRREQARTRSIKGAQALYEHDEKVKRLQNQIEEAKRVLSS